MQGEEKSNNKNADDKNATLFDMIHLSFRPTMYVRLFRLKSASCLWNPINLEA